jgi:hypothetical protein
MYLRYRIEELCLNGTKMLVVNTEIFAEDVSFSSCGYQTHRFRLAVKSLNTVRMEKDAVLYPA